VTHKDSTLLPWQSVETLRALRQDELQLWRIELADAAERFSECAAHLSDEEQARAKLFRQILRRQHFVVGKSCLRILLGAALNIEPRLVPLRTGKQGKPELSSQVDQLAFNVAHSGNTVLIALCQQGSVGVDLEQINSSIDFMTVAQESFTPTEIAALAALTDPQQRRLAFYGCWTRKEAIIKADGRGLSLPMSSFEVPTSAAQSAPVSLRKSSSADDKLFYVSDLPLGNQLTGAVACDTPHHSMKLLRFPPLDNSSAIQ